MRLIYRDLHTGNFIEEELDMHHKGQHLLLDEKTYDVTSFFIARGGEK